MKTRADSKIHCGYCSFNSTRQVTACHLNGTTYTAPDHRLSVIGCYHPNGRNDFPLGCLSLFYPEEKDYGVLGNARRS